MKRPQGSSGGMLSSPRDKDFSPGGLNLQPGEWIVSPVAPNHENKHGSSLLTGPRDVSQWMMMSYDQQCLVIASTAEFDPKIGGS